VNALREDLEEVIHDLVPRLFSQGCGSKASTRSRVSLTLQRLNIESVLWPPRMETARIAGAQPVRTTRPVTSNHRAGLASTL